MKSSRYPTWWDCSMDFEWDHIKLAMERRWTQIKNDSNSNPSNTSHDGLHAATQSNGTANIRLTSQTTFEELQSAFRFGYGARLEYDMDWTDNLEICLAKEWRAMNPLRQATWEQDRNSILYGWNFEMETNEQVVAPAVDWATQEPSSYFGMPMRQGNMLTA